MDDMIHDGALAGCAFDPGGVMAGGVGRSLYVVQHGPVLTSAKHESDTHFLRSHYQHDGEGWRLISEASIALADVE